MEDPYCGCKLARVWQWAEAEAAGCRLAEKELAAARGEYRVGAGGRFVFLLPHCRRPQRLARAGCRFDLLPHSRPQRLGRAGCRFVFLLPRRPLTLRRRFRMDRERGCQHIFLKKCR